MTSILQKKILRLALRAGELMMRSGAEVSRVEDTVIRICHACRVDRAEVFATPTAIFLSIESGGEHEAIETYLKRVTNASIDLDKVSKLNSFAREFTTTDLSIDDGWEVLEDIRNIKPYNLFARLLGAGLICAFFAIFFGGVTLDALIAFPLGVGAYAFSVLLNKYRTNFFLVGFSCTALATFVCLMLVDAGIITVYDSIIIGVLMLFVPGLAITNSMRDFLSGDLLAGIMRLVEALIIAISLASGAGLIIKIWTMTGGLTL